MKELGKKNLFYSILLAAVLMLFLVGYFIWMLPSLYVAYVEEQNLEAIKRQHQAYIETGTYGHVRVKNPTACISIKIPTEENYIELTSKLLSVRVMATDAEMAQLMDEMQTFISSMDIEKPEWQDVAAQETSNQVLEKPVMAQQIQEQIGKCWDKLKRIFKKRAHLPIKIEVFHTEEGGKFYDGESFRIHAESYPMVILESAVSDDNNQYTNYLAFEKVSDGVVFSVLPVITPQMEEIRPIVMQSVPMLCAVIVMLALVFSQIYSNGIVRPVYKKMQDVNQSLLEENERQEMFLRASSHQLKTPITAALLLLDGMIAKIGKYQDRDAYLPKVKEQLLSMQRMVGEILSLNQNRNTASCRKICLYELVQAQAAPYRVPAADKQLEILITGDKEASIWADAAMLSKIIDNLLSNAVAYTPHGNRICINIAGKGFTIRNEGVTIPQSILPHIFEPFVRGGQQGLSHGLGLYIAAYYAKMMGAAIHIRNVDNGVEAVFEGELCKELKGIERNCM